MIRYLTFATCMFFSVAAFAQSAATDGLTYVPATYDNISDALFKKGILRTDDPVAIEEYIRIHHCGLYEQYQRDDFSWARIRESQARDLDVSMKALPDGLEVTNSVYMSQYDPNTGEFGLDEHSILKNVGTLTVFNEFTGFLYPCGQSFVPRMHPTSIIVKLDSPVTLSSVSMSHAMANALVADFSQRQVPTSDAYRHREAMMVFRIRITGVDPLSVATDALHRTLLAQLDEIRLYESPARKTLLFRKTFESPQAKAGKN